ITKIPREVSIGVFKEIAAQTEANECLICFSKDGDNYEVIIRHDNANMAGVVAWLALEAREPVTDDTNILHYSINKRCECVLTTKIEGKISFEDGLQSAQLPLHAIECVFNVGIIKNKMVNQCNHQDCKHHKSD
ncbi:MAG: hypothetical protein RSA84_17180, partial [Acinetobacter sp.]